MPISASPDCVRMPNIRKAATPTDQARQASVVTIGSGPGELLLQHCVDRYIRSLRVPAMLLSIHPRGTGNPGRFAALSPAILLGTISSFESFAEDFTATALLESGDSLGQIA